MEGHTENRHTVISKTCSPPPDKGRNQTSEDSYFTLAATEVNIGITAGINVVINYVTYRKIYYVVRGTKLLALQAYLFCVVLSHKRKLQNLQQLTFATTPSFQAPTFML
jgi:hypothetical protein